MTALAALRGPYVHHVRPVVADGCDCFLIRSNAGTGSQAVVNAMGDLGLLSRVVLASSA